MLEVKAHAKVNLGLNVVAKRGDGFHDIDTVFARLDLHDSLQLESAASGIRLTVEGANLPTDSSNLAYRAAAAYLGALPSPRGVEIKLVKRIPVAAGLGGGSADAAAVLSGLARLYPAALDFPSIAEQLGSDVPFFLSGFPAAHATGRGENLSRIALPPLDLVLVNPRIAVSAKAAYEHLQTFSPRLNLTALLDTLEGRRAPGYFNALQPGVMLAYPELRHVLGSLRSGPLRGALMSGSGSSFFALADSAEQAEAEARRISAEHPEWWVRSCRTA